MNTARAALIVSILACVGAWGGPALARALIQGRDIARDTVTGRNVRDLSGRDVIANGLDGSDIQESTLDTVPHATWADRAKRVSGVRFDRFAYADPTGARRTFLDVGGLQVEGFCNDADLDVKATSLVEDALVRVAVTTPTTGTQVQADNDFDPGDQVNLLPGDLNDASGTLTYAIPGADTVTVTYLAQDGLPAGTGHQCVIAGSSVHATG